MRKSLLLTLFCVFLLAFAAAAQESVHVDVEEEIDMSYDGIDVSKHQGDIDWAVVARNSNLQYVYIKATQGATYLSPVYRRNIEGARKHGLKVGSYHFFSTQTSAHEQFENFKRHVRKEEQDLLPMLDIETIKGSTGEAVSDSAKVFADLVEEYYGVRPLIYTGVNFFNKHLIDNFSGYKLFIARYSSTPPRLNGGQKWILWQFSDNGRVPGIINPVDLSRFNKGCSIKDITIDGRGNKTTTKRNVIDNVNRPSPTTVPPPPRQNKKHELTEEERNEIHKQQEKERKRRAEEAKRKKEQEKAEKEAKKKADEQARKEKLAERERQKAAEEQAKREAEAKAKAERERKIQEREAEQKRLEQQKNKKIANPNGASSDNDDSDNPGNRPTRTRRPTN